MSNTSLQATWEPPDVLNGIIVYSDVNVSSTSIGYFETWRVQSDDPLQLNITDLGEQASFPLFTMHPMTRMQFEYIYKADFHDVISRVCLT